MIFGLGGKYCPACSSKMEMRTTTHRAVDTQGQPLVYYGVRHYTCPKGCATSFYDFRDAYVGHPQSGIQGWQPYAEPQYDRGPFGFLMRIDLSMIIVVAILVLSYAMFVAGIIASETSPGGKIASAALLTAGAFFILLGITTKAPNADEEGPFRPGFRS